jgi:hypothetical protein
MEKDPIYNRRNTLSNKIYVLHKQMDIFNNIKETYHKSLGYLKSIGKTKQKQIEAINNKMEEKLAVRESESSNNGFTIYCKIMLTPKVTYILGQTSISRAKSDTLTTTKLRTKKTQKKKFQRNYSKWIITRKLKREGYKLLIFMHNKVQAISYNLQRQAETKTKKKIVQDSIHVVKIINIVYSDSIWFKELSDFIQR